MFFSLLGEYLIRCILLHKLHYPDETCRKLSILSCLKLEGSRFLHCHFYLKREPCRLQEIVACECVWRGINVTEKPPNHFCSLSSRFVIVNVVRELHNSVYTLQACKFFHLVVNTRLRTHDSKKPEKD